MGQLPHGLFPAGSACAATHASAVAAGVAAGVADEAGGRRPGGRLRPGQRPRRACDECAGPPAPGRRRGPGGRTDPALHLGVARATHGGPGRPLRAAIRSACRPDPHTYLCDAIAAARRQFGAACACTADVERPAVAAPLAVLELRRTDPSADADSAGPRLTGLTGWSGPIGSRGRPGAGG